MPKLLDRVRAVMRLRHYSYETEKRYIYWIRHYIGFHDIRNPVEMGAAEVEAFLTNLAVERQVSASTQNQALFALLFLYRKVLGIDLPWLDKFTPAFVCYSSSTKWVGHSHYSRFAPRSSFSPLMVCCPDFYQV